MSPERSISPQFWQFKLWQVFALVAVLGVLAAVIAPRLFEAFKAWKEEQAVRDAAAPQGALAQAILRGDTEGAREALRSGARLSMTINDTRSQETRNSSPLYAAIALGHVEIVQLLLDHGADVNEPGAYDRESPLCAAASRGHIDIAKLLLERGADANRPNRSDRQPPLFGAISCQQSAGIKVQLIRLLLKHGADIHCVVDGVDPMDMAVRWGDGEVGDLLKDEGLPYGPREMAAFNRLDELKRALAESPDIVHERFESVGWNSTIDDTHITTLLGVALRKNYLDMARMLLEAGAKVDTREHDGRTPLHIAATLGGDPEAIRLLVKHGADVNAVDNNGRTPLATLQHWAKREAAKAALLEAGAK
jgi:ankyrin repeat protein